MLRPSQPWELQGHGCRAPLSSILFGDKEDKLILNMTSLIIKHDILRKKMVRKNPDLIDLKLTIKKQILVDVNVLPCMCIFVFLYYLPTLPMKILYLLVYGAI